MASIRRFIKRDFATSLAYAGVKRLKADLERSNAIVVLDEDTNTFLGVLTPMDIIRKPHNLVIDCLTEKPVLTPDCKVKDALGIMQETCTEVLPVTRNDQFIGLVFKNDLVDAVSLQEEVLKRVIIDKRNTIYCQGEEIKRSGKIEQAIYNSTKSARLFVAPDLTILFFNRRAYENTVAFQYRELKVGNNLADHTDNFLFLIDSEFEEGFRKACRGDSVIAEKSIEHKDAMMWLRVEYHPVFVDNKLIGVSIMSTDITERKQKEAYIQRQNQVLQEILYSQSHELRRPVANILGLANLIKNKLAHTEGESKIMEMLETSIAEFDSVVKAAVEKRYSLDTTANADLQVQAGN